MAEDALKRKVEQLQHDLDLEKRKNQALQDELLAAKTAQVKLQQHAEEEEEFITNKLMKRLAELKKEKETLAIEVEREEEQLTNNLQKKLMALKKDKCDMENQLEMEQEYIVNKLQKQMGEVVAEKDRLEQQLESDKSELLAKIRASLQVLHSMAGLNDADLPDSNDHKKLVDCMTTEVAVLREKQDKLHEEYTNLQDSRGDLQARCKKLEQENFLLTQKIQREKEKHKEDIERAVSTEQMMEFEEERSFNIVSRSPRGSLNDPGTPRQLRSPSLHLQGMTEALPLRKTSMSGSTPASPTMSPAPVYGFTPSPVTAGRPRSSTGSITLQGMIPTMNPL